MKVLFCGDWHGNTSAARRALHYAQKNGCEAVFQLGDFGYGWKDGENYTDWFTGKVSNAAVAYEVPVYWIDGNHENFDKLEARGFFPTDGYTKPYLCAPNVYYVPRGVVVEFGSRRVLACGGAYSVDKPYRTAHVSWWPQEEITKADEDHCFEAGKVDIMVCHDAPNSAFCAAMNIAADGDLAEMRHLVWKNDQRFPGAAPNRHSLERIMQSCQPDLLLHGHYHSFYEADLINGTHVIGLSLEQESRACAIVDLDDLKVTVF